MTFRIGQPVPSTRSPAGIAQVEDLLRTNVQLLWRDDAGRIRRERVNACRLARRLKAEPFLIPIPDNPFGRAVWPRCKTFDQQEAPCRAEE